MGSGECIDKRFGRATAKRDVQQHLTNLRIGPVGPNLVNESANALVARAGQPKLLRDEGDLPVCLGYRSTVVVQLRYRGDDAGVKARCAFGQSTSRMPACRRSK